MNNLLIQYIIIQLFVVIPTLIGVTLIYMYHKGNLKDIINGWLICQLFVQLLIHICILLVGIVDKYQ